MACVFPKFWNAFTSRMDRLAHSCRWLVRRYPPKTVLQYDQVDCGPAVLLTILRYFGGNTSLPRIRSLCRTDREGTRMSDLVEAASDVGISARGVTGEYGDLLKQRLPLIVHVVMKDGLNHYLVVYKATHEWLLVGDPATGNHRLSRRDFEDMWRTRAAVLVEPGASLLREEIPRLPAWILSQIKRHEVLLTQSLFLGLIYTSIGLFAAWSFNYCLTNSSQRLITQVYQMS